MEGLPHCDELFVRYFDRWYSQPDRKRRGFNATKPDMLHVERFIGVEAPYLSPLTEAGQERVLKSINGMLDAAKGDWPNYLAVEGAVDMSWVDAFDRYYTAKRVAEVIKASDPEDFSCDYVVLCCEFGAVLANVFRVLRPRLIWYLDWPYWESMLLDPQSGRLVPVFHWAVKKMSDLSVDDGFADKINVAVRIMDGEEPHRPTRDL